MRLWKKAALGLAGLALVAASCNTRPSETTTAELRDTIAGCSYLPGGSAYEIAPKDGEWKDGQTPRDNVEVPKGHEAVVCVDYLNSKPHTDAVLHYYAWQKENPEEYLEVVSRLDAGETREERLLLDPGIDESSTAEIRTLEHDPDNPLESLKSWFVDVPPGAHELNEVLRQEFPEEAGETIGTTRSDGTQTPTVGAGRNSHKTQQALQVTVKKLGR